jgi:hypothetical protein
MKTLFYAAMAASFVFLLNSCAKEKDHAAVSQTPFTPSRQLNFVHSRLLHPGDTVTLVPIDSNTALIRPVGDTLYPVWYYKERSAANGNARTLGTNVITTDWGKVTIADPQKSAENVTRTVGVGCTDLNKTAEFVLRGTDGSLQSAGTMVVQNPNSVGGAGFTFIAKCGVSYFPEVTTGENGDPTNNDIVIHATSHPFYIYSFQQFVGQGTAYGADMKIVNLLGAHTPGDLLAVIANRNSNSVNGVSYLFYTDVDDNANPVNGHTPLITLPMQTSSFAPKGAAAAITIVDPLYNGRDLVLATYTRLNTESAYSIKYLVGKGVGSIDGLATWAQPFSSPLVVPGFGDDVIDIGITAADLDGNGINDLIVMGISPTKISYRVGYNMNSNGVADFTSPVKTLTTVSGTIIGGGLDSKDGTFVVGYYTNSGTPAFHTSILSWDEPNHAFGPTLYSYSRQTVGVTGVGGGVSIGDLNNDFIPDILSMAYVGGAFRFVVDYTYAPSNHQELLHGICGAHTN